jgi:hypothetical protein
MGWRLLPLACATSGIERAILTGSPAAADHDTELNHIHNCAWQHVHLVHAVTAAPEVRTNFSSLRARFILLPSFRRACSIVRLPLT